MIGTLWILPIKFDLVKDYSRISLSTQCPNIIESHLANSGLIEIWNNQILMYTLKLGSLRQLLFVIDLNKNKSNDII